MAKVHFTEHKEFMRISRLVNEALAEVGSKLDCIDELHQLEAQTNRVADEMSKLFLRAWAINHE